MDWFNISATDWTAIQLQVVYFVRLSKSVACRAKMVILRSPLFALVALAFVAGLLELIGRRGDRTVLGGTVLELV